MPRKKVAKRAMKQVSVVASLSQLEKDFSTLPARLSGEINKELSALKRRESELKKAVAQTTAQLKSTESQIKLASKDKHSAKAKKQLKAAKKALQEASKIHRALVNELNNVSKIIAGHTTNLAKFAAIRKLLAQFGKDWAKKAKKAKKSTAVKKTKRAPKSKSRLKVVTSNKSSQSNIENLDTSVQNVTLDQSAESTS